MGLGLARLRSCWILGCLAMHIAAVPCAVTATNHQGIHHTSKPVHAIPIGEPARPTSCAPQIQQHPWFLEDLPPDCQVGWAWGDKQAGVVVQQARRGSSRCRRAGLLVQGLHRAQHMRSAPAAPKQYRTDASRNLPQPAPCCNVHGAVDHIRPTFIMAKHLHGPPLRRRTAPRSRRRCRRQCRRAGHCRRRPR